MRVILFESDPELGQALEERLRAEGHELERRTVFDPEALTPGGEERTVVLLDEHVPGFPMPWAVRSLRTRAEWAFIVVLGARAASADRIEAFDAGADDYLTKPVTPAEMAVRLRALGRRAHRGSGGDAASGDVRLDPVRRRASLSGRDVPLTPREYVVLAVLLASPGRLVPRAELERQLYGVLEEAGSNSIEVHIHNLRRKLGGRLIRNVRGRGYRFEA